jgi:hypothetical protein
MCAPASRCVTGRLTGVFTGWCTGGWMNGKVSGECDDRPNGIFLGLGRDV